MTLNFTQISDLKEFLKNSTCLIPERRGSPPCCLLPRRRSSASRQKVARRGPCRTCTCDPRWMSPRLSRGPAWVVRDLKKKRFLWFHTTGFLLEPQISDPFKTCFSACGGFLLHLEVSFFVYNALQSSGSYQRELLEILGIKPKDRWFHSIVPDHWAAIFPGDNLKVHLAGGNISVPNDYSEKYHYR